MFCERLRETRVAKKKTQAQIASVLGITQGSYSGYERGNTLPDIETSCKIATILGVSLDYLCGLSDDPYPSSRTELDHQADALAAKLRELPADFLAAALVQVNALAEVAKNREVNAGGDSLKRMADKEDHGDNRENV